MTEADEMLRFGQIMTGLELTNITAETVKADLAESGATLTSGKDPKALAVELTAASDVALGDRAFSRELNTTTSAQKAFLRKVRDNGEKLRDLLQKPHTARVRRQTTPQAVATLKLEGLLQAAGVQVTDISEILEAVAALSSCATLLLDDRNQAIAIAGLVPSVAGLIADEEGKVTEEALEKYQADMRAEAERTRAGPLPGLCEILIPVLEDYLDDAPAGSRHPVSGEPGGGGVRFLAAQVERLGFKNEPLAAVQEAAKNAARKLKKRQVSEKSK